MISAWNPWTTLQQSACQWLALCMCSICTAWLALLIYPPLPQPALFWSWDYCFCMELWHWSAHISRPLSESKQTASRTCLQIGSFYLLCCFSLPSFYLQGISSVCWCSTFSTCFPSLGCSPSPSSCWLDLECYSICGYFVSRGFEIRCALLILRWRAQSYCILL